MYSGDGLRGVAIIPGFPVRALLTILLFFLALPGLVRAQEADPTTERKVVSVRFEGNRRYTDDVLREQIETKEGQTYDPGLIERDKRTLREFFASVLDVQSWTFRAGQCSLLWWEISAVWVQRR